MATKTLNWGVLAIAAVPVLAGGAALMGGLWFSGLMSKFDDLEAGLRSLTATVAQGDLDLGNRIGGLQSDVRLQGRDLSQADAMLGDHEARLRSLEAWQRNVLTRAVPDPL